MLSKAKNREYQREYARLTRLDPVAWEAIKAKGRASRNALRAKRRVNPEDYPVKPRKTAKFLKQRKHGYYLKWKEKHYETHRQAKRTHI